VTVGNPGDAVLNESEGHRLNLFFFRFEPFSFDPGARPGQTGYVRAHCLMTPFAVLEDGVSAGEGDLRLVGEVLRLFQEKPVFDIQADDEDFDIQVILQSLALDQLNQLWSTQGDIAYRPSLLYEISLMPVIPEHNEIGSPLAGSIGMSVTADMNAELSVDIAVGPDVRPVTVDVRGEDWAPCICLVRGGKCVQSLSLAVASAEFDASPLAVWVAGAPDGLVDLCWDIWDKTNGWSTQPAVASVSPSGVSIDPSRAGVATTEPVALPFGDHAGQAVLYATRTFARGVDNASITVRSNPLLVNLYEVSP
jgi:hypothetical protein